MKFSRERAVCEIVLLASLHGEIEEASAEMKAVLEGESQNLRLGYIIIINAFSIFNFLIKIDYKHKN